MVGRRIARQLPGRIVYGVDAHRQHVQLVSEQVRDQVLHLSEVGRGARANPIARGEHEVDEHGAALHEVVVETQSAVELVANPDIRQVPGSERSRGAPASKKGSARHSVTPKEAIMCMSSCSRLWQWKAQ